MQGMDHSNMPGMQPSARQGGNMQGMDHSNMAGMQPSPGQGGTMQGMDHGAMNMPGQQQPGQMAAMDHSGMSGMQPRQGGAAAQGAPLGADQGTRKVQQLVTELVEDPVVRQRIQADSVLRNRWQNPGVRRVLLTPQP